MASNRKVASIGRFGGELHRFALAPNARVSDLLAAAGISLAKGESLALNGNTVDEDAKFYNNDEIVVMPSTTGA